MYLSMLKADPLLSRFSICRSMDQLKQIHLQTIVTGVSLDPFVCSMIIIFCCTNHLGDINYARQVFDKTPQPKVFLWNTMIKGYSRTALTQHAISMYIQMLRTNLKPDHYTFPFLLKGFTRSISSKIGKAIHSHVYKFRFDSNPAVQTSLLHMYSLYGNMDDTRRVFDTSLKNDPIAWNIMITSYNRSKLFNESKNLFDKMEKTQVKPTLITLVSILSACSKLKDINGTKHIHQYIKNNKIDPNVKLNNALLDAYATCHEMDTALEIFTNMKTRDVISWTVILSGFLNIGKFDLARDFFDRIPVKDSVSWTTMINGYVSQNRFKESLTLFKKMQDAKIEPDEFTMVSVVTACANMGALELGEWVKVCIDKSHNLKIKNDVFVGNALIDMYFKCAEVGKAVDVFKKMVKRDKFTWTNMIVGYGMNGFGNEAINMFNEMMKESIKPDGICYLGVLCACMHSGKVDEGRKLFDDMRIHHGIEPEVEHYGCMVDLLGRSGRLSEAYEFINVMPIRPNSVVWRALLGACGIYKDVDLGEIVARKLVELEPDNGAGYVLLCNIYGACNRWEDLREVRNLMMNKRVTKTPGCSCIEVYGSIHEFVVCDRSHFRCDEIYSMLERITHDLKVSGYTPQSNETFLDFGEWE
ncbi:putative pentatricopeptide repeat-containing protein At3g15930 isoform X1 [Lactuca sativa]|uniref:putative pentatricopeptide repeat-containing protein At3g15930 isoform X1 n=2 Tax=Lactuca sativa TaxID=4236 RepID=UPI000CD9AC75|nr:putative pentatricopeptide repeat-containing protein At3g15930 isoform X1 [Lactuca sativa]